MFDLSKTSRITSAFIVLWSLIVLTASSFITSNAFAETYGAISDTHISLSSSGTYGNSASDMRAGCSWVKRYKPSLIIHSGDITTSGEAQQWPKFQRIYKEMFGNTPSVLAMGNHDASGGGVYGTNSKSTLVKRLKSVNSSGELSYRKMKKANVIGIGRCYWLKSGGYDTFPKSDAKWLNEKLLETAREGKWAIIVCHYHLSAHQWTHKNALTRFNQVVGSYPNVIYLYGHLHHFDAGDNLKTRSTGSSANPYAKNRAGYSTSKRYSFHSYPIWSTLNNRAGTVIDATDSKISFRTYVAKYDRTYSKSLNKTTGSVTIKMTNDVKASGKAQVKVSFSDKKTHGGVKNGAAVSITFGKTKKISDIPAGVLVTITPVGKSGWETSGKRELEAYNGNRNTTITFYKAHKITYAGNGATSGSMQPSFASSIKAVTLQNNAYKKTGYAFKGWSTSPNGSVQYANKAQIKKGALKKDITLYAIWNKLPASSTQTTPVSKNTSGPLVSIKYGWVALDANKKPVLQGSHYKLSGAVKPIVYITNGTTTKAVNGKAVIYLSNTKVGTAQALVIGDNIPGCKDAFITTFTITK